MRHTSRAEDAHLRCRLPLRTAQHPPMHTPQGRDSDSKPAGMGMGPGYEENNQAPG